ncbi:MAG: ATP-binding protein [Acidimicrobiia bacterium]
MAQSEIVTLLFTDLVRSTELVQHLGDDAAEDFRKRHFDLLRAALRDHGGREVKNLGDGLMVVFPSAVEAVGTAVAIQRAVDEHNRGGAGPDFQVRIGIHAGEPVEAEGDYFGTPVILAKRLCDAAGAGQILASEIVTGLIGSRGRYAFRSLGPVRLKGLGEPVPVAEVAWAADASPEVGSPRPPGRVVRPATLTPPPDSFIGREAEIALLTERLGRCRLVTVVGPGGVGKTRLCGHVVDAVADRYPDGVWCCALAPVSNEQVPEAVATALRVERRTGMTVEDRLVEFLATKELLLVLDNCEHVIDGAADFASAVLAGAGDVGVLATSREPLGLPGEHRVPLGPLDLADDPGGTDAAPAVALFLERAAAANPGLSLDDQALTVARDLCRRLDGLPLAIELAAARLATRSVQELYGDVSEHLGALSVRRGRPERHRSIAAMVEWSYELLDEGDRRLFERLAVFAGGWHADAARAVAGDEGDDEVLGRLERLVEQSLVRTRSHGSSTRYGLLEPVRAYAEDRLRANGLLEEVRDAHADFFVRLAEQADAGLRGAEEVEWADRLEHEMANLRAAHRWLMHRENADGALRLSGALLAYGLWNIGVSDMHTWAEEAAEHFAASRHPALSAARATAAWGAWLRADLARAEACTTRSLAGEFDDCPARHMALQIAGVVQLTHGRFDEAEELFHRSIDQSRAAGDHLFLVYALGSCGLALAYGGRSEAARRVADAGLEVAAARGNATMRAWANYYAGEVRLETHPDEASVLLARSLADATRLSSRLLLGAARLSMASLEARHGDPRAALAHYPELLAHWERSGNWNGMWVTLRILIETLDRAGESIPAATLYGALEASATAPPLVGQDAGRLPGVLEHLRRQLGPEELRVYRQQGAELGDNGVVAFALAALRSADAVVPPA